jgi:hypothetical protein
MFTMLNQILEILLATLVNKEYFFWLLFQHFQIIFSIDISEQSFNSSLLSSLFI